MAKIVKNEKTELWVEFTVPDEFTKNQLKQDYMCYARFSTMESSDVMTGAPFIGVESIDAKGNVSRVLSREQYSLLLKEMPNRVSMIDKVNGGILYVPVPTFLLKGTIEKLRFRYAKQDIDVTEKDSYLSVYPITDHSVNFYEPSQHLDVTPIKSLEVDYSSKLVNSQDGVQFLPLEFSMTWVKEARRIAKILFYPKQLQLHPNMFLASCKLQIKRDNTVWKTFDFKHSFESRVFDRMASGQSFTNLGKTPVFSFTFCNTQKPMPLFPDYLPLTTDQFEFSGTIQYIQDSKNKVAINKVFTLDYFAIIQ